MRDELERQVGEAEQQLAQMGAEHAKIVATPFSDVGSCGEISIVADAFDQVQGRCREIANVESMVAALRNRAEKCTEFKAAQLVQSAKLPPPIGALHGKLTLSPEKKEDHGKGAFTRTTYEGHRVTWERVDPGQAFEVSIIWDYAGVPASLSAGQAVTITVTGGVARESPPHVSDGLVLAGVVGVWGDITMKFAQQADRGNPVGRYEFIVNQNPRSVEIHLGGAPAGTGVIWRYAVE